MIRLILCIFIALSVATGAMASVYEVHEKANQEARSLEVLSDHSAHNDVSSNDNCADHCVNHCSIWQHLMSGSTSDHLSLNPQIRSSKGQWLFISLSEKSYTSQLLRPPSLIS